MTKIIPKHGGYRKLRSYIQAEIIYDATIKFCDRYISIKSRTHDQMVQAARSCVQNIAEGSQDSATSKKVELKLTGIARGSLEELLLDYEAYLRQKDLPLWADDDPRRKIISQVKINSLDDLRNLLRDTQRWQCSVEERSANAMTALIKMTSFLLDRQLKRLEDDLLNEGGITERIYSARKKIRTLK